jgi:hypothetical protein
MHEGVPRRSHQGLRAPPSGTLRQSVATTRIRKRAARSDQDEAEAAQRPVAYRREREAAARPAPPARLLLGASDSPPWRLRAWIGTIAMSPKESRDVARRKNESDHTGRAMGTFNRGDRHYDDYVAFRLDSVMDALFAPRRRAGDALRGGAALRSTEATRAGSAPIAAVSETRESTQRTLPRSPASDRRAGLDSTV